jgi:phosphoribosylformylglycinamidine synthase
MPAAQLVDAPTYTVPQERPAHEQDEPVELDAHPLPDASSAEILLDLMGAPNIASRRWVWEQYDHQVQLNTVLLPGGDAAVLRVKQTGAGLAVCTDGNGRHAYLDPYRGGKAAVAEAARNVSCVGALPIAITDCLNFGNPENPPIAWQLAQTIQGMADACRAFAVPVISGNVSLYNESFAQPIYPTPVVGMLGLLEDVEKRCGAGFGPAGDALVLLGDAAPVLDGSEYQKRWYGRVEGRIPDVDLAAEVALQQVLRDVISVGLIHSAHDCADGGLAVTLAESCLLGGTGARVHLDGASGGAFGGRHDLTLFGEAPTRVVVSCRQEHVQALAGFCADAGVPWAVIGSVGGDSLRMELGSELVELPLAVLRDTYEEGIPRVLAQ